jgi:hypothetical protein
MGDPRVVEVVGRLLGYPFLAGAAFGTLLLLLAAQVGLRNIPVRRERIVCIRLASLGFFGWFFPGAIFLTWPLAGWWEAAAFGVGCLAVAIRLGTDFQRICVRTDERWTRAATHESDPWELWLNPLE